MIADVDASEALALIAAPYSATDRAAWDGFVRSSRNGTFLFERDYMEYHSDRFTDHSLIIRDAQGAVVALLPAARSGDTVVSHAGLTYGGFVTDQRMTVGTMQAVFSAVRRALIEADVVRLVYKTIPSIYHAEPADEDQYWLFRLGARLYRRDVLSVIRCAARPPLQERRRRALAKARSAEIQIRPSTDYAEFWSILTANLQARFGVAPVHTAREIELLAQRFPESIRLYTAHAGEKMVAGAVLYVTRTVCHVQYNAAAEAGRRIGALDAVLARALDDFAPQVRFFDFGASTEQDGHVLNEGLVEYKEGFGGRTIVHDMYEWDVRLPAPEVQ